MWIFRSVGYIETMCLLYGWGCSGPLLLLASYQARLEVSRKFKGSHRHECTCCILKGSWDLVTRVIIRVTILIATYNPN